MLVALLDRSTSRMAAPMRGWRRISAPAGPSCPLTENGCLRVLTNPRYAAPVPALEVLAKLATAKTAGHHEFWADDLTITDAQVFDRTKWRGHQQVTDTYLLALAVKHSGRLVTFDTGIALDTVRGAMPHHLLVL